MNVRPDLSIVIVNWNTRDILLECLSSIEEETSKPETEVIVVDNGSEDDSVAAVRDRFPEAIVIENGENLGFARANNIGMRPATGRYLCFVNSDILVRRGALRALLAFADADPGIGIAGPRILNPDLTLQDSCRRFPSLWTGIVTTFALNRIIRGSARFSGEHMMYFPHDRTIDTDYIAGCFMMVRREAIDAVGPMDERFFIYSEEVDWCKRMWAAGWRVVFHPGAEVIHHHGVSSSRDPSRFNLERQKALLAYWRKHHGKAAQAANIVLIGLRSAIRIAAASILIPFRPASANRLREIVRQNRVGLDGLIRESAGIR